MQAYVALLRGINLGARNKVSMPDLRALFTSAGAEDVSTYIQSGNVVFKARDEPAKLIERLETGLRSDLGVNAAVLLRTQAELAEVVARNPFATSGRAPAHLHVTFLAEEAERARLARLDPEAAEPDEFHVVGREIYLHCPNGYGRSKLTNAYFEKQLAVTATTRNWNTVTKLAELARG